MRKLSVLSIEKAAQAWQGEKTSKTEMDVNLALEFARILDEVWSKPWLGNATTEELIQEIRARIGEGGLRYKTTGEGSIYTIPETKSALCEGRR
jgi:hypothetical protein